MTLKRCAARDCLILTVSYSHGDGRQRFTNTRTVSGDSLKQREDLKVKIKSRVVARMLAHIGYKGGPYTIEWQFGRKVGKKKTLTTV